MFPSAEVSTASWTLVKCLQELEQSSSLCLCRSNQTSHRSPGAALELFHASEWQIRVVPRDALRSRDVLPGRPHTLFWVSGCEGCRGPW